MPFLRLVRPLTLLCGGLLAVGQTMAADPVQRQGIAPTDAAGRPLNFDFESGSLRDWKAEGEAFTGQPIEGDTVAPRRGGTPSAHSGKYWIGGYERLGDIPTGTLTSVPFPVKYPWASFLVAGGPHSQTRVEIVSAKTGKMLMNTSGDESETLKPIAVDLHDHLGEEIFIRIVDNHTGGWGHVNFDDFRFHEKKPAFSAPMGFVEPDRYTHQGLAPEAAAKAMTVPDGFHVSLFAGEPDVKQPIAMAFDDRGRLWVAEAYSYPIRLPDDKAHDRILIFEDTNGDGQFDRRTVFVDNLNLVSGFELGYGGVFVGAAPYLLFIPDRDHNDKPDGPPEVLLDGWAYQDTHETLNSFIWGPDGWLYGCHGVFTHSRVGKPGTPDNERQPINAGIWRYHPQQKKFELFAEGTSNPWGFDFNDRGQGFLTACVIPHLYHAIQGGRYQRQAGQHFNPFTYGDIQTIARHRHYVGGNPHGGNGRSDSAGGGHAHAGAMIYLGGAWPQPYRDQIFMNNIHGARLNQDALEAAGSGYSGDRAPDFLLANDTWSQILNLTYGPDGQVYMIDWYDNNQCHHGNDAGHDRSNGRIFKISYDGAKAAAPPADLASLSDDKLVELQLSANDWQVRHARRLLAERAAADKLAPMTVAALEKIAFEHPDDTRRLRGLWGLHAVGQTTPERTLRALADASPYVRGWAIQLACERQTPPDAVLARLRELAKSDPSPVVRLYLASAAGRINPAAAVDIAASLISHSEDQKDHNLPLLDWYAVDSLVAANPDNAWPLLSAAQIPQVRQFLIRRLAQSRSPQTLSRLIDATLGPASEAGAQVMALEEINNGLRGERRVELPANWPATFARLVTSTDPALRSQATTLATTFGDPQAIQLHYAVLVDRKQPADSRRAALGALAKVENADLPATLQKLLDDPAVRGPALQALAGFDQASTPAAILAAYPKLTPGEKRDALATLASRPAFARQLLSALDSGALPRADVTADVVRQLRNLKAADVEAEIVKVWGAVRDTPAAKAAQIDELRKMLTSGPAPGNQPDLPLGRAVFARACQQCHTLFSVGSQVGPDLTGSNRANLDYLLSNIVDPSALVGKDYQAHVITTDNGRVLTGLVRQSNDQSITLQTANETLVIPRAEIDQDVLSVQSMMPEDLTKPLSERELRSLVAYLASPNQVLMMTTPENVAALFNGRDLTFWQGNAELWHVEDGQLVGRTAGLSRNEFLRSDLLLGDFTLNVQVKLVGNRGNSGIQFRSAALDGGEIRGYQADIGGGWWGKLYEENGRGILSDRSGEEFVKLDDWNDYRIECSGHHVRTWINDKACVDLDDPTGDLVGCLALQLHSGEATEVRYRDFRLELPAKK